MTAPAPAPAPASTSIGSLLKTKTAWAGIIGGIGPIFTGVSKILNSDSSGWQDILTGVSIIVGAIGLRGALASVTTALIAKA